MPDTDDPDGPDVPDADPSADVYVRADRTLYAIKTRNRRSYHLFTDCRHLVEGYGRVELDAGDIWEEGLTVCSDCERREQIRAMLADGVPANPTPGDDWHPADENYDATRRRWNAERAEKKGDTEF